MQRMGKWMMRLPDAHGKPTPIEFPPFYKEGEMKEHTKWVHAPGHESFWDPAWNVDVYFCDAFTIEPEKMISQRQGLWEHGKPKPVVESLIANSTLGTLPHVQVRQPSLLMRVCTCASQARCTHCTQFAPVATALERRRRSTMWQTLMLNVQAYLFSHATHGTTALFPWYGAKGGGANKTGPGQMFEHFDFWHTGAPQSTVDFLHENQYCNQQEGLANCKTRARARYDRMSAPATATTKIDPDCWMVRAAAASACASTF